MNQKELRKLLYGNVNLQDDKVVSPVRILTSNRNIKYVLLASLFFLVVIGVVFSIRSLLVICTLFLVLIFIWKLTDVQRKKQKMKIFEEDYVAFLSALSSSIRGGLEPLSALLQLAEEFSPKSLMYIELIKLRKNHSKGFSEEDVVSQFAISIGHPDLDLFRISYILAQKQGGSLSRSLNQLLEFTRLRQSSRRRYATAVVMQKVSAIGIALSATFVVLSQWLYQKQVFELVWKNDLGQLSLCLGIVLLLAGLSWMFIIGRQKI